ncbi:MAG: alpha-amylase family glycosyl hydrolase [Lamprobacter sp.]|uniref:alpha-amylase family glycosyl hydrolase n=1 Tax=Lamprobacter sp. TaxID=3100796 RepID=UPI002B25A1F4|nr:alpha-amylase family glycosyl hydrolase [Lamprobacter sp.]MEA3639140.1 alpha-amylase family glycosyl hydrolase [Lamprobacter sp.]
MSQEQPISQTLPTGVMLNAYPDSIGGKLADIVAMLKRREFKDTFSLFYILPTFFNSDLDRGFSIIDYGLNEELVTPEDLAELHQLNINFKLDLVLNHLSVQSHQFQDLIERGNDSPYKDFFVDWNEFWHEHGTLGPDGSIIPTEEYLQKLFMRKPGLPILKVRFPDGSDRLYWNTFYQDVSYGEILPEDLAEVDGLSPEDAPKVATLINQAIAAKADPMAIDLDGYAEHKDAILSIIDRKRQYLGQMDLNARSEQVWSFYEETLRRLRDYGAKIIRLDAFAYLHKAPGEPNFFNRPGTWDYLERLKRIAEANDLIVFPEIHAEYGTGLHEEVASKGFPIYDFFFPGLVIDALERGTNQALLRWIEEIRAKGLQTINMLGCHDGIPLLDLRGKAEAGSFREGLLDEEQIEATMARVTERGGRVKNLYGPDGRKIAYYQINATFFSALGEDEQKLLMARAIQLFMPGIPQVWYLDLFAGKNDYQAADRGGAAGHKEINRTNLSLEDVEAGLKRLVVRDQLKLIQLRNTCPAFQGHFEVHPTDEQHLRISWHHGDSLATLDADLRNSSFRVSASNGGGEEQRLAFER